MIINLPKPYRRRPAKAKPMKVSAAALVLVAAQYEEALYVRLTFDRAIDIAAINPGEILVKDGLADGQVLAGWTASMFSPTTVEVGLVEIEPFTDEYTALYASNTTGIKAVNDGGTWAGVFELPLPYP